jgi:hypothetical protein
MNETINIRNHTSISQLVAFAIERSKAGSTVTLYAPPGATSLYEATKRELYEACESYSESSSQYQGADVDGDKWTVILCR